MSDIVILLTCTINVKGMTFTALTDVQVREKHYLEAIEYYFNRTKVKIVIVENTGHDFSRSLDGKLLHSKRLEILSFNGNNFPKELGKGYGELEAISYAMNNSKFISADTLIIKVTGRYKVSNIQTFIKDVKTGSSDLCQFLYFKGHKAAFSGIFIASRFFLKNVLEKNHQLMDDSKGVYFEHILARSIIDYRFAGGNYKMLKSFPRLIGISGTDNKQHPTNKLVFWLVRNFIYKALKTSYSILEIITLRFFYS